MVSEPALEVDGLNLYLDGPAGNLHVVRSVGFAVRGGEVLGLIGESGSGKTMTGLSLLRLEPKLATLQATRLMLGGVDLMRAPEPELRRLRGRKMAMIFQDPVGAFNPAKRIAWHARAVLVRNGSAEGDWRRAAEAKLAEVEITDTGRVLSAYPHQLSGGMLQRVLIALVLAAEPLVIIADEPTTNLDNIVEKQILRLFRRVKHSHGAAFLFITHDMSVAAALSDRIAVMYAGEIVEIGPTAEIFSHPHHPYTAGLIRTSRALQEGAERLPELTGEAPSLAAVRQGCAFAPRCPERRPECATRPIHLAPVGPEGRVRCLLYAGA